MGVDYRVLNGPTSARCPSPTARPMARGCLAWSEAGCYFQNWDKLTSSGKKKIKKVIRAIWKPSSSSLLPEMVNLEWVAEGRGIGSNFDMQAEYNRLIELGYQGWQYHFEFFEPGLCGLSPISLCSANKPSPASLSSPSPRWSPASRWTSSAPDEELKRLAKLAVDQGVADVLKNNPDRRSDGKIDREQRRLEVAGRI